MFRENYNFEILGFGGNGHLGAHHCIIKKAFSLHAFITFFLNDLSYHFLMRPFWSSAVDLPILNNLVLTV